VAEPKVWTASSTNAWNDTIAAEFRANGGTAGGRFEGAPLLILHTTGARTGKPRMNPLMYLPDGPRYVLFATYAGNPKNPAWYFNLRTNPDATIEIGTGHGSIERVSVRAQELVGAERDALYAQQVALFPGFGKYEEVSGRQIPVLALERT
jgi:deazaflavin-dependent oxidoreductase (nitroreductase family)